MIRKTVAKLIYGSDTSFKVHECVRINIGKNPDPHMLKLVASAAAKYNR